MHHREALRVLAESSKLRKLPCSRLLALVAYQHGHRSSNLHEAQTFEDLLDGVSLLALWRAVNWCVIGQFAVGLAERAFSTKPWLTLKRCGHICGEAAGSAGKRGSCKGFQLSTNASTKPRRSHVRDYAFLQRCWGIM